MAFTDFTTDAAGAGEICARALGQEVRAVSPCDRPTSFVATLEDGRQVVLKVARPDRATSPAAEAWAYEQCCQAGLRVPEVLAVIEDPEALVLTKLHGSLLERDPSAGSAGWRGAGADLRAMHAIGVEGFGPLAIVDGHVRGEAGSWCPQVEFARNRGLESLADRGLLTTQAVTRLLARYEEIEPRLREVHSGSLLNGDLWSGHVFVDATGGYAGMIDFDQAQAGDPLWDLARVPLWDGEEALDCVLDGYGAEVVDASDRELLLPLYLLAFCIHHIVRVPFTDDPSFPPKLLERCDYKRLL